MDLNAWIEDNLLIAVAAGDCPEFAFYLYKNGDVIERLPYSVNRVEAFRLTENATYQIKVFGRQPTGEKERAWSKKLSYMNAKNRENQDDTSLPANSSTSISGNLDPENNLVINSGSGRWQPNLAFLQLSDGKAQVINQIISLIIDGHRPDLWTSALAKGPTPSAKGWFNSGKIKGSTEALLTQGWQFSKFDPIRLEEPIDWASPGQVNRTWGFELHAWRFIDPFLEEYFQNGDLELLKQMLKIVQSWWRFAQESDDDNSMVWYDMALSLRMPRLARLTIAVAQSELSDQTVWLFHPVLAHISAAKDPSGFHPQNNHGFYSAAAALDFSKWLPHISGVNELRIIGEERMAIMVDRQFAADGGHLEHSPDYHRMLLASFEHAIRDGLIQNEVLQQRIAKAADILGWMVQPDGHLVQFGDSPSFKMGGRGRKSSSPTTEFILTDGLSGHPTEEEILVLPNSGYAFVRSPQPARPGSSRQSSYLAFQAGFHSRAHKHADDLTFTWFDRGREIIIDSGRYGYGALLPKDSPDRLKGFFYAAPERQYVESTRAHNTVEVNHQDIERRGRQPYGSALGECLEVGGTFVLRGEVDHGSYSHHRVLELVPGKLLKVVDTLTPKKEAITAVRWFNLDGSLDLNLDEEGVYLEFPERDELIRISGEGKLIPPVKGQTEELRGWRSRFDHELEPAWNLGFSNRIESATQFFTIFEFVEN